MSISQLLREEQAKPSVEQAPNEPLEGEMESLLSNIKNLEVDDKTNFEEDFIKQIVAGLEQQLGSNLVFSQFDFDKEENSVYGHKIRVDKLYNTLNTLMTIYSAEKTKDNKQLYLSLHNLLVTQTQPLFQHRNFDWQFLDFKQLKELVVRLYIFREMSAIKIFDAQFFRQNPAFGGIAVSIENLINILNSALSRLNEIFAQIHKFTQKPSSDPS
jgi:hypothetical protein